MLIYNMPLMSAKNDDFQWRGIVIFLFSVCIVMEWHSFIIWSLRGMISFFQGVCQRTCLATKSQERPLNSVNYSTKQWSSMKWMAQFRVNKFFIQIQTEQNTTGINAIKNCEKFSSSFLFLKRQFIQICKLFNYLRIVPNPYPIIFYFIF